MPLSDEPCEAPCPALNETVEGSGNGTANATETEEPEEEGMYSFDNELFTNVLFPGWFDRFMLSYQYS